MIRANKFGKNLIWLVLLILALMLAYFLTLYNASLRSELDLVDREIVSTTGKIRYLEAEFETRTSQMQLEKWNQLEYGYVTPDAEQFVDNSDLGSLTNRANRRQPIRVAAMTVDGRIVAPAGEIRPVETVQKGASSADKRADGDKPSDSGVKAADRKAPVNDSADKSAKPGRTGLASKDKAGRDPSKLLDERLLREVRLKASVESLGRNM